MKTFTTLFVMTLVQLSAFKIYAYIPPLDFILKNSAALAGNSIISVEQDVTFKDSAKTYTIKETWLIEGDRNLRLSARGTGELKDAIIVNYLYNGKNRTALNGRAKVVKPAGVDFFEKFLAVKSKDSYLSHIKELGIGEVVRLSRAAGTVSFAIGNISTASDPSPHFWFDQDSFRLNKIRLPSDAEIELSDYTIKDKIHYPRFKNVTWSGKNITIKVTKINTKASASIKSFYPESLDQSSLVNTANFGLAGAAIDEFYSRFR